MPAASVVIPAGALRFARAPRPGLLPATTQKAQISAGLSFCLDEKRGSRHRLSRPLSERLLRAGKRSRRHYGFASSNDSIMSVTANPLLTANSDLPAAEGKAETWWKPVIASGKDPQICLLVRYRPSLPRPTR